eukprot:TRINITY_DN6227_c0_g1_i1.p2 TRINITY_DN6227_c0_g1~~TRINITY_DN6227_c0_g1_i1.p2  ORF type:complete len:160 (-),score=44.41 TRINITY_DN6227_c0_g1_i1:2-481(-)
MTLIGIGYKGDAVAGVMFQPFVADGKGRNMWGMRGWGTSPIKREDHAPKIILTTTRTHSSVETDRAIAAIAPDEVLRVGGAGYKALQVLEGTADVYVFATPGTKKWDTCAPEAIIRAAGGELVDMHGKKFRYTKDEPTPNPDGILCVMADLQKYLDRLK